MVFTIICPHCSAHVKIPENACTNTFRHGITNLHTTSGHTDNNAVVTGNNIHATICSNNCCYAFYDNNGKESYVGDNSLLQNVMVTDLQYMTLECCGEEFEINYNNSGTMEGNIHQGHSSIRNITVKKIVPRNYFEGKSISYEYSNREYPLILPKNCAPGDILLLDISLDALNNTIVNINVSRKSRKDFSQRKTNHYVSKNQNESLI